MTVILSTRQEAILSIIVKDYIDSGNSVSSSRIASKCIMPVSSATVRNECHSLDELGFIEKQHRSSGNIPTLEGLRYYVEEILPKKKISNQAKRNIKSILIKDFTDTYDVFVEMGELLSFLAKQLGLIVISHPGVLKLFRIEAIPIASNAIRLVLVFDNGQSRSFVFKLNDSLNNERLVVMVALLNERLNGLTLTEIHKTIKQRLNDILGLKDKFLEMIVAKAAEIFSPPKEEEKIFVGKKFVRNLPEENQLSDLFGIALTGSDIIKNAVEDYSDNKVSLHLDRHDDLCLVSAGFSSFTGNGIVGFVGHHRLPYHRIVPLIEFAATQLSIYFLDSETSLNNIKDE